MNLDSRHNLIAALLLCGVLVAMGRGQYIEDSVDVGAGWVGSLAYNSREDVLYGRCQQAGIFFAISCDSNKVIKSFSLSSPRQMTYDAIDNKAYCPYVGVDGESLAVIDGLTHTFVKSIGMPGATTAVWDSASDRVYVSCQTTNKVAVVDCVTDSLLKYISVGACPIKLYINTLHRKLYVLNYDNGTVSIVNMATNQVIKNLFVGGTPNAGYYSPSADKFYSAGDYGECIVIDGAADSVVAHVVLPGNVDIFSATGDDKAGLVYLGTFAGGDDYAATISARNDSLLATVTVGREPRGLLFYEPSGLLYVASSITDEVYVTSRDGAQVLDTLNVGNYPYVFAAVPLHNRLYLGHEGGTYVYVLKDTSVSVAEPQPERSGLRTVNVTPNPFRQSIAVAWPSSARPDGQVRVRAPDGRLVRHALLPGGACRWVWNGRDDEGRATVPGVYVVEVGERGRQKVVKLRR